MKKTALAALLLLASPLALRADRSAPILDLSSAETPGRLKPTVGNVSVAEGPEIKIAPGTSSFPGVTFTDKGGGAFDLSTFGFVQAEVTNTSAVPIAFNLRLDNDGDWKDNPWNADVLRLKPGATGTIKVYFGYSYGKPAYALKPDAIKQIMLFTGKSESEQSFRINSLVASGSPGDKPPVNPGTVRVVPKDGVILGAGVPVNPASQLLLRGAKAAMEKDALRVTFSPSPNEPTAALKPAEGKWDLGLGAQVRVKLKNSGRSAASPTVWVEGGGATRKVSPEKPIAPGAEAEIIVPYASPVVINLANKEEAWKFSSADVTGIVIGGGTGSEDRQFDVLEVVSEAPGVKLPEWIGKRPPVDGDWKLTLDEDFKGNAINENVWMFKANNHWDANKTHFTKENVIVGGGIAKVRYEKKEGFQNDDPAAAKTPYATGYLRTYDKWTQRYGYFETRLKVPKTPGLWPGVWTMPDRGPSAGDGVQRQDTKNGGMEFDIMENLTRWGPYRYNVAMHWDGYGKEHKAQGSDKIYAEPDKDGYITSGMLWVPGLVAFYVNGREVARWENERVADVPSYLIVYLPSGGWDNNQTDDAKLPADFEIDYIRVWQRGDLASDVDRNSSDD